MCINQDDVAENHSQILKMKDIYLKAEKVLAWLSETDSDSNLAAEFISEMLGADFYGEEQLDK